MRDHNLLKHPLNKDFFHAEMTIPNKDFSMLFFQNFAPKQGFAQKFIYIYLYLFIYLYFFIYLFIHL